MKYLKIILLILCGMLLLWMIDCTIGYFRYRDGLKPLIVLQEKKYSYDDGYATVYRSFGYQVIMYEREWMKQSSFSFGFKEPLKKEKNTFQIIDETGDVCPTAMYYFYEDENYKYYFTCLKNIYIKMDDVKVELEKALMGSYVTIEELMEQGLDCRKEEK